MAGSSPRTSLFLAVFFSFAVSVFADAPPKQILSADCPQRLREIVHSTIDRVALSRPESTDQTRHLLVKFEREIRARVAELCPNHETCSREVLHERVLQVAHEVLDENPQQVARWRGQLLFGTGLATYLATTVWVTLNAEPVIAAAVSSMLTILGAMALTDSGAAIIEPALSLLRRWSYAADATDLLMRGAEQKRHARIYRGTQEAISSVEEEARTTDRHGIFQINLAKLACSPHPGETRERFLERSAYIFAKVLSDIVPQYPELDFSEPMYSTWSRVLFSQWYLDDKTREPFQQRVLQVLRELFDPKVQQATLRWERYERVLHSWTAPMVPVTLPPDSHPE